MMSRKGRFVSAVVAAVTILGWTLPGCVVAIGNPCKWDCDKCKEKCKAKCPQGKEAAPKAEEKPAKTDASVTGGEYMLASSNGCIEFDLRAFAEFADSQ